MHVTHDHTTSTDGERNEVWADVKAPGDGRVYSVGTIEVETIDSSSTFSDVGITKPTVVAQDFSNVTPRRQVVVLQVVDSAQQIVWQKYFYGDSNSGLSPGVRTAGTNARGIAVWPATDPLDMRIAICGETYDMQLPASQLSSPLSPWSAAHPTGFVAVYDGSGNLLWTHQFYSNNHLADCAITDLSIRVEQRGESTYDVVTYCGMSTHGAPSGTLPLSPLLPFAPLSLGSCTNAGGDTDNGDQQWDGIVGRLVRSHAPSSSTVQEFHSIVGGVEQDACFGIVEASKDIFYVVATTTKTSASTTLAAFPNGYQCLSAEPSYCVGALLEFDASATVNTTPGDLVLAESRLLGTVAEGVATCARDVTYVYDTFNDVGIVHVVGSTTDEDFVVSLGNPVNGIQASYGGGVDGFLVTAVATIPGFNIYHGGFYGGSLDEMLTGVAVWNEFPDHVYLVGYGDTSAPGHEIHYASVYGDAIVTSPTVQTQRIVRRGTIGGSAADRTAVMGDLKATDSGSGFDYQERDLGSHAGGGAAVDHRSRLHVAGATSSDDLEESPSTWPYPGRVFKGGSDGVRLSLDMLPIGVWRTDGTGTDDVGTPVAQPGSGIDGGTTPAICRGAFGIQIFGSGLSVSSAKRILLDYDGPAPDHNETPIILIDRPHFDTGFLAAVLDVSILGTPSIILGMETWLNPSTATTYPLTWTGGTMEWQLGALPAGPFGFSLQVFCLLNTSVPCFDPVSSTTNYYSTIASPALTIEYN